MYTLCLWFGFGVFSFGYDNIALHKPTHQESPYHLSNSIAREIIQASNAVDGLKSNRSIWGGQCAQSGRNKQTATWWVNLTSILSIHHVTIYYRTENSPWGSASGYPSRFLGFSIYVSNTTDRFEGTLCYKDTKFRTSTIPAVFNTSCLVHGQYVIYYNERLQGVTYPDGYSQYAWNEICEFEVLGCRIPGYYGLNCSIPCPDPNCRYCDLQRGTCQGCKPGYQGHHCELECDEGHYGEACQYDCGHCADNTNCHHVSGTCLNGCEGGYMGPYCKTECNYYKYGVTCTSTCGYCLNKTKCHRVNGSCLEGCDPGFQGDKCLEVLSDDTDLQLKFYGMTGAFCFSFIALIAYIIVTRKSKKRCCNKQQEKEDHYVETIETEAVDPGYCELGDFSQSSPTYFNLDYLKK